MTRVTIADARKVTPAQFLEMVFGPKPGPTPAEKLIAEAWNRPVEERRTRFADRMERAGFARPSEDELTTWVPEPLVEVERGISPDNGNERVAA